MMIETNRLLIRDLSDEDEKVFIEMSADGSLNDIGFDIACEEWMTEWISEAKQFAIRNNPYKDIWHIQLY